MENKFLPWSSITREERFFCSHLYHSILGREKKFATWLNENLKPNDKLKLNDEKNWEVSYEVCFYRDFLKANGETIKDYNRKNETEYSPKRTFDICLFSPDEMIIIEAKVQQGFSTEQIKEIDQDKILVEKLIKDLSEKDMNVETILLYSKKYSPREEGITKFPFITWEDLQLSPFSYKNYFERANAVYGQ